MDGCQIPSVGRIMGQNEGQDWALEKRWRESKRNETRSRNLIGNGRDGEGNTQLHRKGLSEKNLKTKITEEASLVRWRVMIQTEGG